jgi:hypothetical protein
MAPLKLELEEAVPGGQPPLEKRLGLQRHHLVQLALQ